MALALLQRVVWNTSGWRRPTATSAEGDYVGEHGFGHEEWNFQTDDAVDGNVLGYLYYAPAEATLKKAGGRFDIGFWTLHPQTKGRFMVGRWRGASLAPASFMKKVDQRFAKDGTYERRANELRAVRPGLSQKAAYEAARHCIRDGSARFMCPIEAVEAYSKTEFVRLPSKIEGHGLGLRFASPTFVTAIPGKLPSTGTPAGGVESYGTTSPLAEDGYYREVGAQLKTILPKHNKLSNEFAAWLKDRGCGDIRQEVSRVDVEFTEGGTLCRAELKVCDGIGTTKGIREAIGQLFEYNHYGIRVPAAKWFIVLDREPAAEDRQYIRSLQSARSLPLVLAWRSKQGFALDA